MNKFLNNSYALTAARWSLWECQKKRLNLLSTPKYDETELASINKTIRDLEKHIDWVEGLTNE